MPRLDHPVNPPHPPPTRWAWRAGLALVHCLAIAAFAAPPARFPAPEFERPYVQPLTSVPAPRTVLQDATDVAVLTVTLAIAAWLVLRRRSRAGVVALSLFSIAYFGFYRQGCICPIGAIQNVASALADPSFVLPWSVTAIFLVPLLFTAFAGRVYCAAVCPLGVLQDLVVWKPRPVPPWLEAPLRLLPPLYLGLAVLLAATGADYVICRYDPFVGFYRLGGSTPLLLAGAALLVGGLFVGRVYCRFGCPYGVLLGWISRYAFRHATITPEGCVSCRLCENACPFDSIHAPDPGHPSTPTARRTLKLALLMLPVLALLGATAGFLARDALARLHPRVRLAERVAWEDQHGIRQDFPLESEAFRASGQPASRLAAEAGRIRGAFRIGVPLLGAFMGLLAGIRMISLARRPPYPCHDMDQAGCVSCARCFAYCPVGTPARTTAASPLTGATTPPSSRAAVYRTVLSTVGIVSACFCLLVGALLLVNHARFLTADPLNANDLVEWRRQFAAAPDNEPLKPLIRTADLHARQAYFSHLEHNRTGAWLMLGGALVLLASLGLIPLTQATPPNPGPASSALSERTRRQSARQGLAIGAALLLLVALLAVWRLGALSPATLLGPEPQPAGNAHD